jgi:hypothetical protein
MPRMIDLIRASAVPANLMQSAARGALSVPAVEMLEILVYLATQNKVFSDQAVLTLAGWEEASSREAAGNPNTPKEVLDYLVAPQNFRPTLLPALLGNPAIGEESLSSLAASISRDLVDAMLKNVRITRSKLILAALASNPNLSGIQSNVVEERLASLESHPAPVVSGILAEETAVVESTVSPDNLDAEADPELAAYLTANASEIAAEADKGFQVVGATHEETGGPAANAESAKAPELATETAAKKQGNKPETSVLERGSALQKIAKLDITGRIQLAMKGTKEERALLIRDGTKIVALAVLESPKISDGEVEKFASQKNVLEAVLRQITIKRRFMKNYAVVRNLVFNPRTPLDVALGLMKNLLVNDLKNLSGNKEVPETVRKLGLRMFKQKLETKKD